MGGKGKDIGQLILAGKKKHEQQIMMDHLLSEVNHTNEIDRGTFEGENEEELKHENDSIAQAANTSERQPNSISQKADSGGGKKENELEPDPSSEAENIVDHKMLEKGDLTTEKIIEAAGGLTPGSEPKKSKKGRKSKDKS